MSSPDSGPTPPALAFRFVARTRSGRCADRRSRVTRRVCRRYVWSTVVQRSRGFRRQPGELRGDFHFRFDLAYATGRVPHEQKMATIELYGREVIPRVREILADPAVELDSPTVSSEALRTETSSVSR